jgi:hypothetical protein
MRAELNKKLRTSWRPFEEARKYVHGLKIKNRGDWVAYCKSGKKPKDIPASPSKAYKHEWKNWGDWLGTYTIAVIDREFRPFEETKEFIRGKFKNKEEYEQWAYSRARPKDIPGHPARVYTKEWKGWPNFLGYEETGWSIRKVKELLKGWIESGMIYDEDDLTLFDLLHVNGLLHLKGNRHEKFFKNLIEARHSAAGLDAIKKYVNSDIDIPPEFTEGEMIEPANSEEIAKMVESEINPLDYGKLQTPEEILKQSERLESYSEDSENMQFHVNKHINRLWSRFSFRIYLFESKSCSQNWQ